MRETGTQQTTYALGHSDEELERLNRRARAFEPFTRQLLRQAGISAGLRVLDVGCGAGDVAFLVADLVGPRDRAIYGIDDTLVSMIAATAIAVPRLVICVQTFDLWI